MIRTSPWHLSPRIVIGRQRATATGVLEVDPEPASRAMKSLRAAVSGPPPGESLPLGNGSADPANARGPESARAAAQGAAPHARQAMNLVSGTALNAPALVMPALASNGLAAGPASNTRWRSERAADRRRARRVRQSRHQRGEGSQKRAPQTLERAAAAG